MKHMKKVLSLIVLTLVFGLVACSGPKPENEAPKAAFPGTADPDMVTLNVTSEPENLNPMLMSETISQSVLYHCMSGMTRLNEKDEPVADLAERWDMNEDKTVYTMHLRKDAKWSNGDPVTANDYIYAWKLQMTPATGSVFAPYLYNNIKNGKEFYDGEVDETQLGLKAIDDYTLEIQWSHPMTNALFFFSQPYYMPMNQKAYESIGEEAYAKEANQMVTNGAYKITEWVHDDHILMEKSEDYHNAASIKIPKVKLVMISDANTGVNAFSAGEIDLTSLYSEHIQQLTQQDESAVKSYIDGGSWFLDFNTQDKHLSNVNLRKALAYSIDVQSLLDHVINDGSVAADGLVPTAISGDKGESYAKARGSLFAYNKDSANGYLTQALTELNLDKAGLKLTFWATDTTYNQNQAAYLQQQWKENLGLDVELKVVPGKALSEAKSKGEYTFTVGGVGPDINDAIAFLENYKTGNPGNRGKYSNPEYDRLIDTSSNEGDSAKRQELLIQAEKILIEDMAVGPMYFTCTKYAQSGKVEGLVRSPFQFFNVCFASFKK